jgi:hypothetical protein
MLRASLPRPNGLPLRSLPAPAKRTCLPSGQQACIFSARFLTKLPFGRSRDPLRGSLPRPNGLRIIDFQSIMRWGGSGHRFRARLEPGTAEESPGSAERDAGEIPGRARRRKPPGPDRKCHRKETSPALLEGARPAAPRRGGGGRVKRRGKSPPPDRRRSGHGKPRPEQSQAAGGCSPAGRPSTGTLRVGCRSARETVSPREMMTLDRTRLIDPPHSFTSRDRR